MKRLFSIAFAIMVVGLMVQAAPASAQATAKGYVYDASVGLDEPIVGATVIALGRDKKVLAATSTDIDGVFIMRVPWSTPYKIQISCVGYIQKTLPGDKLYFQGSSECTVGLESESLIAE